MGFGLPDLTQYLPMLQSGLADLKNCLGYIYSEVKASRAADEQIARTLAQEFGVVDEDPSGILTPRRLSRLPLALEATVTAQTTVELTGANQGRPLSRGFYANLGDAAFQVVLVGLNGAVTNAHTVPPGTTIALSSFVEKIIVTPGADGPAFYQVYGQ